MAWLNLTMSNQTVKNGLRAKNIELVQMNCFSQKTTNKFFMYLLAPLICKILKKLLKLTQSYEDALFSGPKLPICPEQIVFSTNHCYYFHLPIDPFHCAKFKKFLTVDPEL